MSPQYPATTAVSALYFSSLLAAIALFVSVVSSLTQRNTTDGL